MAAQSELLTPAQRALVQELEAQEAAARRAWTTAQERTAAAVVEEQAALTALNAAADASRAMKDVLSRICAGYNVPAQPQPVGQSKAGSLTADVLAEVFKYAIDMYDPGDADAAAHPSPAILTSAVSRHWRNVAIATPSLWSKIRLRFSKKGRTDLKTYLGIVVSRARRELLDVVLLNAPATDRVQMFSREDEAALIDVFSRCSSLQLSWDQYVVHFLHSLMPLLQVPMPHLTNFRFVAYDDVDFTLEGAPDNVRLLSLCPSLRRLEIRSLPFRHLDPGSMPLLESFHVRSPLTASDTLAMARAWPKLRSLQTSHVLRPEAANPPTAASFGALTNLACGHGGHNILQNFTSAEMPILTELSLRCFAAPILGTFVLFVGAHGLCTSLRTLSLYGLYAQAAYPTFSMLPNLETLRLFGLSSDGVGNLFSDWSGSDTFVVHPPRLLHLHLEDCDFGNNASHALLSFVEARKRIPGGAVSAIRELSLVQAESCETRDDVFEPWMTARVQQLVDNVTIDTARAYPTSLVIS